MNRFIAFLKCSTTQILCLPLSFQTLFRNLWYPDLAFSWWQSLGHHCRYNQEVFFPASFVIFVLNDSIYHFMARPLWTFAVDSPVLNNVVLTICALSLLGNPEGLPRPLCASSHETDCSFLSFALSNCLSMQESFLISPLNSIYATDKVRSLYCILTDSRCVCKTSLKCKWWLFPFMQLSWWIAKMPARNEMQVCADGAEYEYWLF